MSDNENTSDATDVVAGADLFADESESAPVTYEKGTWQATLQRSATLFDKSAGERKRATVLLWQGGVSAIEDWLPNSDTDVSAEGLSAELLAILGKPRKGDASKIKTVALAVKNNGLLLSLYPNLSKAYAEARRLTQTVAQEKSEDAAADKAIESLAVPNSTTTVEGAALILLSKGLDGAVVAILDALGATNEAAHRSFMRAVSTEIAARVQAAKPKPAPKAGPKAGATQATPGSAKAKAAPAKPGTKPKQGAVKGKPVARPAAATKGKPVAKGAPVAEPVHVGDDIDTEHVEPVATPVVPKGKPVVKGRPVAVKRAG